MSKTAKSSPPKPNVLKGSRNRAHNFEAFVIPIQLTIKGRKCTLAFASLSSWQSIQNVFFLTDAECSKNSKKKCSCGKKNHIFFKFPLFSSQWRRNPELEKNRLNLNLSLRNSCSKEKKEPKCQNSDISILHLFSEF